MFVVAPSIDITLLSGLENPDYGCSPAGRILLLHGFHTDNPGIPLCNPQIALAYISILMTQVPLPGSPNDFLQRIIFWLPA